MKIICVGRNYIAHAHELNNKVPDEPLLFLKPETALLRKRQAFFIPDFTNEVHYETELVIRICKVGKHIQEKFAHTYYNEIALGIDFTARDIQHICKTKGWPWEIAKAFDGSAAVGSFVDKKKWDNLLNIDFELKKNDDTVQKGNSKDMIFSCDQLISYISRFFTLKIGDIIFTGTPAGVGPVKRNDRLNGYLAGHHNLSVLVK